MSKVLRELSWKVSVIVCLAMAGALRAQGDYESLSNTLPKAMEGVRVDEKLGEFIPADLPFRDHRGMLVSLKKVLESDKPVILTLNYSNCPGLCIAQLNGLIRGVNEVSSLQLGTDFHLISVSIDPRETTDRAKATQQRYSQDLFDQHDPKAWQFWTGSKESIAKLTDAVGFRYTYDEKHDQYNHPTAAIFISPTGKITRYLYELGFNGNTFKMATIEAGEGRVGSSMDMIALWCVHYDPSENRYSASARRLLSISAGVFVAIGLAASVPFWLVWRSRSQGTSDGTKNDVSSTDEAIRRTTGSPDQDTMDKS
jgi:protein SCO1/2